jgi:glucose/arabinose dehydrogenase
MVAELGTGRVLSIRAGKVDVIASGLRDPVGVAIAPDGSCLVSEAAAGRVVKLTGSGTQTVLADLQRPQGILVRGRQLYVVDADAKVLIAVDLEDRTRHIIASGLPVGAPPGVVPKPLKGMPPFSGPQGPFAGIAAGTDGTIYMSADADGSVLAFREERRDA